MARALEERGGIFANDAERKEWQNRSVERWNKREAETRGQAVTNKAKKGIDRPGRRRHCGEWDEMLAKPGSDGFIGEMLLNHVGEELTPKFRMAKTGGINKNLPPHLANAQWVREPESVFKAGRAYKQALDENQKLADKSGLNLFMSQWMEWDRIRNRFEPHENMFPGLSRICRRHRSVSWRASTQRIATPGTRTTEDTRRCPEADSAAGAFGIGDGLPGHRRSRCAAWADAGRGADAVVATLGELTLWS